MEKTRKKKNPKKVQIWRFGCILNQLSRYLVFLKASAMSITSCNEENNQSIHIEHQISINSL